MYKVVSITYPLRRISFYAAGFLSVASLLFYVYFISQAVSAAVKTAEADKEIAAFSRELTALETAYIEKKSSITAELAKQLGFQESENPEFISRKALSEGLSLGAGI
ncbi:MAG: hypothetical protein UX94_C0001G0023 [Parcubacteria group bacterium GW2011_GWA2_47_21]|nr:MAG: hypothetical protein UX94_C0001G0023 [Parcubacteria group bacterium GW2011_GWA2_47_21]